VSDQIMQFFEYEHLPPGLKEMSSMMASMATAIDNALPESAEKTAGLRKLLEAKDCFVRAVVTMQKEQDTQTPEPVASAPDPRTPDPTDPRFSYRSGYVFTALPASAGQVTDDVLHNIVETLPVVHLFSNSHSGNGEAMALSDDGVILAMTSCSSRGYLLWDLHDDPDSLAAAKVRSYHKATGYRLYVHPVDDPVPNDEILSRMWEKLNPKPQGSAMEGDYVHPHDHDHPRISAVNNPDSA
jgi:hypothetical protein